MHFHAKSTPPEKRDVLSGEIINYKLVCLCLLRRKQIINPDRFLGLSGIVVLFDKLEFVELSGRIF